MTDYSASDLPHAEITGHALVQDLLPLYLEGEVSPETYALITDHLKRCERCSGFLAGTQSARAQILREQEALRNAQARGPTVAQVQQPIADSAGRSLWTTLMILSWLMGLAITFFGVAGRGAPGILIVPAVRLIGSPAAYLVIGPALVLTGLGGLQAVGQAGRLAWRILSLLTGLQGAWLILSITDPYTLIRFGAVPGLVGLVFLLVAAWGLWAPPSLAAQQQAPPKGPRLAISAAAWGLLGAAGLIVVVLIGLSLMLAPGPQAVAPRLVGIQLVMAGSAGLLELNQQRGWIAQWAVPRTKRRLLGLVVCAGGLVWSAVVLNAWGIWSPAFLAALATGAGLVLVGAWWFQRNK